MSLQRRLSIVVPVRDNSPTLAAALGAIIRSELTRDQYELIVIDDGSTDGSAEIAARYADTVVRLTGRRSGSAYARNRGAELSNGEILGFVDPNAMVSPDTLAAMLEMLTTQPALDAVSACHQPMAQAHNLATQYWNLLLRFGETGLARSRGDLASPCALIRRDVFFSVGMYDEWRFRAAPLEGLDLGNRLEAMGHRVTLTNDVGTVALERRTVRSLVREVWNRSSLLARSLGYQRTRAAAPHDPVFTLSRPIAPFFAALCGVGFTASAVAKPNVLIEASAVLLGAIALNAPAHSFFARARGPAFAIAAAPLHLLLQTVSLAGLCAGWVLRDAVGDSEPDAITQAYAEVGVNTWPPVPRSSTR